MKILCWLLGHHWAHGYGDVMLGGEAWVECGRCLKRKWLVRPRH